MTATSPSTPAFATIAFHCVAESVSVATSGVAGQSCPVVWKSSVATTVLPSFSDAYSVGAPRSPIASTRTMTEEVVALTQDASVPSAGTPLPNAPMFPVETARESSSHASGMKLELQSAALPCAISFTSRMPLELQSDLHSSGTPLESVSVERPLAMSQESGMELELQSGAGDALAGHSTSETWITSDSQSFHMPDENRLTTSSSFEPPPSSG